MFMLDLNSEFGALVNKRLLEEEVIWFTTVSPRGIPAPNPVWFFWDGEIIFVYSQPKSYRVRNIKHNPNVALHLQSVDGLGNNVAIINGLASFTHVNRSIPIGYWKKYSKFLPGVNLTEEEMVEEYSVEIRVKPMKLRGG
jgi:PPOX class probable F420-dependent enzyme